MTSSHIAVLLVDGYNIIGSWTQLKRVRDRVGMEAARQNLTETLASYSAFQGYNTQLVFDAHYRDSTANCETISENLSVYYTNFGQTADTYIEKICALSRYQYTELPQRVIVATSDRAQQLTILGYGAEWMSAQQLFGAIRSVNELIRQKQRSARNPPGRFLAHHLDPVAKQRLERLRSGLG